MILPETESNSSFELGNRTDNSKDGLGAAGHTQWHLDGLGAPQMVIDRHEVEVTVPKINTEHSKLRLEIRHVKLITLFIHIFI